MTRAKKMSAAVAAAVTLAGSASAADWTVSGFVREEAAVKLSDKQNITDWAGNPYNGVAVENAFSKKVLGQNTTLMRPASQKKDADFNMLASRAELNIDGKLSENLEAHIKFRLYSDLVGKIESAYRDKNLFQQSFGAGGSGGVLGKAGKDWMVDLPLAYLDYSDGPLSLRVGNQQIAWGEALFFRVADVANGLDLRRHTILDVAAEEFSDKRVASPAVRATWRMSESSQLEGFAQLFRPTVIPTENSPYNIIPAQFIVDQRSGYEQVKNKVNIGLRLQTQFDEVNFQAFAVRRNNPDGVFRWTKAQGAGAVGDSAFASGTDVGVYSAQEWFRYASLVRLDGLGALQSALNEFNTAPLGATGLANACGATGSAGSATATGTIKVGADSAACILDGFFSGGNLRGWLVREYPKENVFGFGLNKVFSGEPDSFLDQLIGRFEFSYTPNKRFTNPTLSRDYIKKDEKNFAFILEKYHKFSQDFPATYMVLQWMHKSESDLFGRSLVGSNNIPGFAPRGQGGGSNNLAFVLQQPTPSLEWRFDLAVLTDTNGGWLVQPGVKWKLNKNVQIDIYSNYLKSSNKGRDFAEGLEYGRELFVRASYFF